MLQVGQVRDMYRSEGPVAFAQKFQSMLGLGKYDPNTKRLVRSYTGDLKNNVVLEAAEIEPNEITFKGLAHAIFGNMADTELWELIGSRTGLPQSVPISALEHMSEAWVQEAGENVPSQFSNISAFNSAALGLLEAKMLEVWNRPEFVSQEFVETVPSDLRSQKFIGVGLTGLLNAERKPGDVHQRVQLPERYVTTPDTVNRGVAIDITREAILFDRTGQIMANAERIVEGMRIGKENRIFDTFVGLTNSYKYGGTGYNTYLTSGNWINQLASNPLTSFDAIANAMKLASLMTDQESGQPIAITGKNVATAPVNFPQALHLIRSTTVETLPSGGSSGTRRQFGENPLVKLGLGDPSMSIWLYNRLVNWLQATYSSQATLSTAQTTADGMWFWGDFKGAFGYLENIPFTTQRATPDSYQMLDRGIVSSIFTDEMGTPFVKEPRKVQMHFPTTLPT